MSKTQYLRDSKGQFRGSISGEKPPTAARKAKLPRAEEKVEETTEKTSPVKLKGEMLSLKAKDKAATEQKQEAKGTDAPPLAIQIKKGRSVERLYINHPDLAEQVQADPEKALEEGTAVPSLTSVLKHTENNANILMGWALKLGSQQAADRMAEVEKLLKKGDYEGAKELVSQLNEPGRYGKTAFQKEITSAPGTSRDAAATRGTEVHAIIEDISRGGNPEVSEEMKGFIESYQKALEDPRLEGMKYVHTEVTVWGDGYAGTADAIVEIDGKLHVLDYKTNARGTVYRSVGKQLAGIADGKYIVRPDGSREEMPKIEGGVAMGLGPNGKYSLEMFNDTEMENMKEAIRGGVKVWKVNRYI